MADKKSYSEKLRDPRWQKMRLKILERDDWTCQGCADTESTLHVHHRFYTQGAEPWDYPDEALLTLCEMCHQGESEMRPRAEQYLLAALRKHFLAHEIAHLGSAFLELRLPHAQEVFATALGWLLKDDAELAAFMERYFVHLRELRQEREPDSFDANQP